MAPALDEVYDDRTLAALDAWRSGPGSDGGPSPAHWRGRTAAGALIGALALGAREALGAAAGDEPTVVEVEVELGSGIDPLAPVSVWFVPGSPAATVALVRPWCFHGSVIAAIPEAAGPSR